MKLSLTLKLTLAFIFTSLIGVLLVGVITRYVTAYEFDRLLRERTNSQLLITAKAYYQEKRSWAGFDEVARRQAASQPQQQQPPLPGGNNPSRNNPNQPPPPLQGAPQGEGNSPPVVIVDRSGVAVTNGGQYRIGDRVPDSVMMQQGSAIELNNEVIGTVVYLATVERDPREQEYLARTDRTLIYATVIAAIIALIVGVVLARVLTKPLRDLTRAIRAMQSGELKQEVKVMSNDEVGELVSAFNKMSADLAHLSQLREQMTADIAHDLRSPLTVISGYLEILRDGSLEPSPERFDLMFKEAQRLQNLIEDLRTLSLADAGELKLYLAQHSSAELLRSVAMGYEPVAKQKGVELKVDVDENLPTVSIDHGRMMQVVGNLVSNALRYTPKGGVITLKATRERGGVQWTIEDSGVGIPPEKLANIFDRFYRADASRQDGGSGLGLAIVKSIVEAHRGTIRAMSEVGKGTMMMIQLPA
ncbi:MAG: HAMP domain-containing histidine kinase [Chloroflexi bacterium]|nr:HAMP domain-containing histidine kinase [Chloroflexota bacterium]